MKKKSVYREYPQELIDMTHSLYDFGCSRAEIHEAEKNYGNSWKQRGGQGAFMMLARKWDRLELQSSDSEYDIFKAVLKDARAEGVIDDIRDLRRYLLLVEAEVIRLDTLSKNTIKKPPTPEEANYLAYAEFLEDSCETQTN